ACQPGGRGREPDPGRKTPPLLRQPGDDARGATRPVVQGGSPQPNRDATRALVARARSGDAHLRPAAGGRRPTLLPRRALHVLRWREIAGAIPSRSPAILSLFAPDSQFALAANHAVFEKLIEMPVTLRGRSR